MPTQIGVNRNHKNDRERTKEADGKKKYMFFHINKPAKETVINFLIILSINAILSTAVFWLPLDQDNFAFLYAGKGLLQGKGIFADFADNKGPLIYCWYSLLYFLFKERYRLILFISHLIIDTLAIFLASTFGEKILSDGKPKNLLKNYIFILLILTIVLYKSASLGPPLAGFYPEQIEILLLLTGFHKLIKYKKRSWFTAGICFALAILSRQTAVFFSPVVLYLFADKYLKKKTTFSHLGNILLGGMVVFATLAAIAIYAKNFKAMIDNMITFNLTYGQSIDIYKKLPSLLHWSASTFVVSTVLLMLKDFWNWKDENKYLFRILSISGLLSIFVGGIVYHHHFLQLAIFLIPVALAYYSKVSPKCLLPTDIATLLFLLSSCVTFTAYNIKTAKQDSCQKEATAVIKNAVKATDSTYIQVVPYYPEYYLRTGYNSPDRYYQQFFVLSYYNKENTRYVEEHKKLSGNKKLDETLFVTVSKNSFDKQMIKEYIQNFGSAFDLKNYKEEDTLENCDIEIKFFQVEVQKGMSPL